MAMPKGFDVPFKLYSKGSSPNVVEGTDALDRSIRTIIQTFPGERVYRPTFGCNVRGYIFSNMTEGLAVQLGVTIQEAIRVWEPRVRVSDVKFEIDGSTVYLTITWRPAGRQVDATTVIEFQG